MIAIVTGSGRGGIGRSIAVRLAKEGFAVAINVKRHLDEGGEETLREVERYSRGGILVQADVATREGGLLLWWARH